jgi:hypothetical protein
MKLMHKEGKLLHVNWQGVKDGLSLLFGRLIHQAIKVHMVQFWAPSNSWTFQLLCRLLGGLVLMSLTISLLFSNRM